MKNDTHMRILYKDKLHHLNQAAPTAHAQRRLGPPTAVSDFIGCPIRVGVATAVEAPPPLRQNRANG